MLFPLSNSQFCHRLNRIVTVKQNCIAPTLWCFIFLILTYHPTSTLLNTLLLIKLIAKVYVYCLGKARSARYKNKRKHRKKKAQNLQTLLRLDNKHTGGKAPLAKGALRCYFALSNNSKKLSAVTLATSANGTPFTSPQHSAPLGTNLGSFCLARRGTGANQCASVSMSSLLNGKDAAVSRNSSALAKVRMPDNEI